MTIDSRSHSPTKPLQATSSSKHKINSLKMGHSPDLEVVRVPSGEPSGEPIKQTQMARAYEEKQELHKSAGDRAGLKTVKTSRVSVKTTTITKDENEKPAPEHALVEKFRLKLDNMRRELDELECRLKAMAPIGKDRQTVRSQISEIKEFIKCVEKSGVTLDKLTELGKHLLDNDLAADPQEVRTGLKQCRDQWQRINDAARKRLSDLERALDKLDAKSRANEKFRLKLDEIRRQLDELEHRLDSMAPVAADKPTLLKQRDEMKDFMRRVDKVRDNLNALEDLGEQLIRDGLAADPKQMRAEIKDCKDQLARIESRAAQRMRDIEDALRRADRINAETEKFNLRLDAIRRALAELKQRLDSMAPVASDRPTLLRQKDEIIDFIKRLDKLSSELDLVNELGEDLIRDGLAADPSAIREGLRDCKAKLAKLYERARKRLADIDEALRRRDAQDAAEAEFKRAAKELADWLDNARNILLADENVGADLDTVNVLIEQHKSFSNEILAKKAKIDEIKRRGAELLANSPSNAAALREIIASIDNKSYDLDRLVREKSDKLNETHRLAEGLHNAVHSLLSELAEAEKSVRATVKVSETDVDNCINALEIVEKLARKLNSQLHEESEQIKRIARGLLSRAHLDGEPVLKHWLNVCQNRFNEVDELVKKRVKRLTDVVRLLKETLALADELLLFLTKHEARLIASQSIQLPHAADKLNSLLTEHKSFINELQKREASVDKVVRVFSLKGSGSESSRTITQTIETKQDKEESPISLIQSSSSSSTNKNNTSFASYKDGFPEVCNAKAKLVVDKWRAVWQLTLDKVEMIIRADCIKENDNNNRQSAHRQSGVSSKHIERLQADGVDKSIQKEIAKLNATDSIHHVGDGLFKISNVPRLVKVRAINGNVLVKSGKNSTSLENYLRTIRQQNQQSVRI